MEAGRDEIGLACLHRQTDAAKFFARFPLCQLSFRHAAQGLGEKKQIFYPPGPVGGGESSIAECLKQMMEQMSFYALKGSPISKSSLGLFNNLGPLRQPGGHQGGVGSLDCPSGGRRVLAAGLHPTQEPWRSKHFHRLRGRFEELPRFQLTTRCSNSFIWR